MDKAAPITHIVTDFQNGDGLWEILIIIGCVLLAMGLQRLVFMYLDRFREKHSLLIPMLHKLFLPFTLVVFFTLAQSLITELPKISFIPDFSLTATLFKLASTLSVVWLSLRLFFVLMYVAFQQARWVRSVMRIVEIIVWIGVLLSITGWLKPLAKQFGSIGLPFGDNPLTLGTLINGVLVIGFTLLFTLAISALIERQLLHSKTMPPNLQVVLSRLVKTLLITVGILASLVVIGFPLASLSIFGGALGVGLGFGLQKIMSNYISGFIILLDRSVEIGDLVTINNYYGQITQITTRYMVVRGTDSVEAIVPNETVLTSIVSNHSYLDRLTQLTTQIRVSYDADIGLAMRLMSEAAKCEQRVLRDPLPSVFLKEFIENAIVLQMNFWIGDPESGKLSLVSRVNVTILELFRENDIKIVYTPGMNAVPGATPETEAPQEESGQTLPTVTS